MPGRGVLRPTLTLPESVPMTPDQCDQAVAALATMICDWLRTRAAAGAAGSVERTQPQQPGHES
jgi:hypothetical protein